MSITAVTALATMVVISPSAESALDTLQPDLLGLLLSTAQKPAYDHPLASLGQVIYMYFSLARAATKELPIYV